jgi:hypothetical protein
VIDAVRLTFAALREAGLPRGDDLVVRSLPSAPLEARLAIDSGQRPHLLLPSPDDDLRESGSAAIKVSRRALEISGDRSAYVDVSCEMAALTEVFDHFIVAVIDELARSGRAPSAVVAETVERWKLLLAPAGGAPSRDRLAALFGELLLVLDILRADPQRRIDLWVGPHGDRYDIRRGRAAVEVKTIRSHTARVVTIHGEDQLVEPNGGTLHLHVIRLEETPSSGRSVPDLVDRMLAAGARTADTFDAVAAAGLSPADFPAAAQVRFEVRERLTVPIDDHSPRIVPSSFIGGERPVGVVDVVYRIDVDHMLSRRLSDQAYDDLVRGIAAEADA